MPAIRSRVCGRWHLPGLRAGERGAFCQNSDLGLLGRSGRAAAIPVRLLYSWICSRAPWYPVDLHPTGALAKHHHHPEGSAGVRGQVDAMVLARQPNNTATLLGSLLPFWTASSVPGRYFCEVHPCSNLASVQHHIGEGGRGWCRAKYLQCPVVTVRKLYAPGSSSPSLCKS